MKKTENQAPHFHFKPVNREHRSLVHYWLKEPHVAKWFYGQGLQNTFNHLDDFLNGSSKAKYWLGYDQNRPFAFLITSSVEKPEDELTKWCSKEGEAITLDLLIGEADYLGKGFSQIVIQEFLLSQFPNVAEVLIDPEATNAHAIHIYKKVGFRILGEFIPSHSPHPHYMMHLDMQELMSKNRVCNPYIIDCLSTRYGITVTQLILLPLGADMNASVYKAQTQGGLSYFLKLKRGHADDISVAILVFLQASGIQQIIAPIKATDGELIQHINDFTLTVYPFVDGQNGFCFKLTEDQWVILGKVLRQVHELDVPPSIKDLIRKEAYSAKWRDAVQALYAQVDGNLTGDETTLKLQAFIKEHRGVIDRLIDRASSLSQKIKEQSLEFVLCHSDIHAGNVLIDGNGAIYIVDWDGPIMAPKERDLMFIGGGVANVWNNPIEEEFFYKGYGKTKINRDALAYYRHERIVEDIAEYGEALLLTSGGGESRREMYKQFMDMFEPNGVVDIAFKTGEWAEKNG